MTRCLSCPTLHVFACRPMRDGLAKDTIHVMVGTLLAKDDHLQRCPRPLAVWLPIATPFSGLQKVNNDLVMQVLKHGWCDIKHAGTCQHDAKLCSRVQCFHRALQERVQPVSDRVPRDVLRAAFEVQKDPCNVRPRT